MYFELGLLSMDIRCTETALMARDLSFECLYMAMQDLSICGTQPTMDICGWLIGPGAITTWDVLHYYLDTFGS